MFSTQSSSIRPLRRRVGIAAASAVALAIPFLGATPAGAAAGDLDSQFSGDGIQTGVTGTQKATASYLQADGKLVVAGNGVYDDGTVQKSGTYVARYDAAGTLDSRYGTGGVKIFNALTGFETVRDIAGVGTGSVLVGYGAATYPDDSDIYVAKVNASGQPATTFGGGDGIVTMNLGNHDRVGGIVVKGTRIYVGVSVDDGGNWANKWTVLALKTTTGAVDTTFSGDGKAEVPTSKLSTFDSLRDLVVQGDGKIILGGSSSTSYAVARFTTAGVLDTTFSADGVMVSPVEGGGAAYQLLLQADKKIVLVGYAYATGRNDQDFAAVRFTTAGALDTSFGGDGKAVVDSGLRLNDNALSGALSKDGKIVLGGFTYTAAGMDFGAVRLNWNGTEDTSFSGDGRTSTSTLATSNEQIESVTIGAGDRVYGIGENLNGWALVAYQGDAVPSISVNDVSLSEPDTGTANVTFKVSLSAPATSPVTVKYATTAGTATTPADFTAKSGTVSFAVGKSSATVVIAVKGDKVKEPNEAFTVNLSLPTNSGIADASGTGSIVNDD